VKLIFIIFFSVVALAIGYTTFEPIIAKNIKVCDMCQETIYGRGVEIRDKLICERCLSELVIMSKRVFGNMWCGERMQWIYDRIVGYRKEAEENRVADELRKKARKP